MALFVVLGPRFYQKECKLTFRFFLERFVTLITVFLLAVNAFGQASESIVRSSLIVTEISDISIQESTFYAKAELSLMWRPTDETSVALNLGNTIKYSLAQLASEGRLPWIPEFFVANSVLPRERMAQTLTVYPDGTFELFERFGVALKLSDPMPSYPFGSQKIELIIMPTNDSVETFRFIPKLFQVGNANSQEAITGNWNLIRNYSSTQDYPTLKYDGVEYLSKLNYTLLLDHDFFVILQAALGPIFLITLLSLFINRYCVIQETESGGDNGNWRIGGQLTLLLTVFALKFSLGDQMPQVEYLTFLDALFIISEIVISLCLFVGILSIYKVQTGDLVVGQKIDRLGTPIISVVTLILFTWSVFYAFI